MNMIFRRFSSDDRQACCALFDANCPDFFLPNERADYVAFLDAAPEFYEVCVDGANIVGAFGLAIDDDTRGTLCWIMIDPSVQGKGIGKSIMARILAAGRDQRLSVIRIAASHKSAPFFANFGAEAMVTTRDGWGPGMDRIDMQLPV